MSTQLNYLFLLLGILLADGPAVAQNFPTVARPDTQVAAQAAPDIVAASSLVAAPDTAAAIHRLFAAKRKSRRYVMGGTALAVVAAATIVLATAKEDDAPTGSGGGGGAYSGTFKFGGSAETTAAIDIGVLGLLVVVVESVLYNDWRRKTEQQVLTDFEHKQLPLYVKKRLKAKYFR